MAGEDKRQKRVTRRALLKGIVVAIAGIAAGDLLTGCGKAGKETGRKIAVVNQNRKEVNRIDLDAEKEVREIQIPGVNVVLQAEKGRIRYLRSDCPDQICVKTGWLTGAGQMAACLPNKSIVTIEGS